MTRHYPDPNWDRITEVTCPNFEGEQVDLFGTTWTIDFIEQDDFHWNVYAFAWVDDSLENMTMTIPIFK